MFEHLQIKDQGNGVVAVEVNRPPANSVNDVLLGELTTLALDFARESPRAVTVSSSQRIFMAGADLGALRCDAAFIAPFNSLFQATMNTWALIPCPTIALINGHALGGGCEFALACDWRIMARGKGRIGFPEVHRALLAAGGGTQRTTRLVGPARAKDLLMRGRLLDADEAMAIGLVSEACDAGDLDAKGEALALELAQLPKLAVRAIKRCVDEGLDSNLAGGLAVERREMLALADSADTAEGVQAFVEKRDPIWTHR